MNVPVSADGGWWALLLLATITAIGIAAAMHGRRRWATASPPPPAEPDKPPPPAPTVVTVKEKTVVRKAWVGPLLGWVIIIIVGAAAVVAIIWAFQHIVKPIAQSPVPVVSLRNTQAKPVTVSVPEAGLTPVCAPNDARVLKLTQEGWTNWQSVPAGCAAQVDIPPDSGKYRMQCRDLDGNVNAVCTTYTAIRFQKVETADCLPMTLQLWFVPIKA